MENVIYNELRTRGFKVDVGALQKSSWRWILFVARDRKNIIFSRPICWK